MVEPAANGEMALGELDRLRDIGFDSLSDDSLAGHYSGCAGLLVRTRFSDYAEG